MAKALLLLACLLGVAFAAGEVEVKYWFPDNPTAEFVAGSTVKAVLGINNAGQDSVNVSYAGAQLAWPFDASTPVYNFTGQYLYDLPLAPGQETSVEYTLNFHKSLPPREFQLLIYLYTPYREANFATHVAYNQTISVVEPALWIDVELIGLFVIGIGSIAGIGYMALEWAKKKGYLKKQRKSKLKKTAAGPDDKSDYLQGTHGHAFLQKKAASKAQ